MTIMQAVIERLQSRRIHHAIGAAMIAIGLVMLLGVAGYYAYAHYARSNFDDLSFTVEPITADAASVDTFPTIETAQKADLAAQVDTSEESNNLAAVPAFTTIVIPQTASSGSSDSLRDAVEVPPSTGITDVATASSGSAEDLSSSIEIAQPAPISTRTSESATELASDPGRATESTGITNEPIDGQAGAGSYNGSFLMDSFAMSYPGVDIHPKYWDDPLWAGSDRLEIILLPQGFVAVSYTPDDDEWLSGAPASRMVIASIGVDAIVDDLRIIDLGDSQAYETPKNIVGHIPSTANPGEYSNGWYFGHLQSPIRGEGNVFRSLPKLSKLIGDGDPLFVALYSSDGAFLYQVVKGEVVHPSELELTESSDAEITLVTCYPPLVYDHRYVVTAKLVGVRN